MLSKKYDGNAEKYRGVFDSTLAVPYNFTILGERRK